MSIDINWNLFDKQLSHEIQDKLNQYLDTIENPDFLGKLMITNLDFGTIPPDLEIIDICDPSIEFYENSDEDYDEPMSSVSPWESASQSGSTKEKLIAEREGSSNHCQIECALRYKGDLTLKLSAEVLIHHPTPNFITLPLTLTLKHLELNARVICAYLGDTVNFCLNQESRSVLRGIQLESEIGDIGKQVLKNVSKIENFITDQLKSKSDDLLSFPSFYTFSLDDALSLSDHL